MCFKHTPEYSTDKAENEEIKKEIIDDLREHIAGILLKEGISSSKLEQLIEEYNIYEKLEIAYIGGEADFLRGQEFFTFEKHLIQNKLKEREKSLEQEEIEIKKSFEIEEIREETKPVVEDAEEESPKIKIPKISEETKQKSTTSKKCRVEKECASPCKKLYEETLEAIRNNGKLESITKSIAVLERDVAELPEGEEKIKWEQDMEILRTEFEIFKIEKTILLTRLINDFTQTAQKWSENEENEEQFKEAEKRLEERIEALTDNILDVDIKAQKHLSFEDSIFPAILLIEKQLNEERIKNNLELKEKLENYEKELKEIKEYIEKESKRKRTIEDIIKETETINQNTNKAEQLFPAQTTEDYIGQVRNRVSQIQTIELQIEELLGIEEIKTTNKKKLRTVLEEASESLQTTIRELYHKKINHELKINVEQEEDLKNLKKELNKELQLIEKSGIKVSLKTTFVTVLDTNTLENYDFELADEAVNLKVTNEVFQELISYITTFSDTIAELSESRDKEISNTARQLTELTNIKIMINFRQGKLKGKKAQQTFKTIQTKIQKINFKELLQKINSKKFKTKLEENFGQQIKTEELQKFIKTFRNVFEILKNPKVLLLEPEQAELVFETENEYITDIEDLDDLLDRIGDTCSKHVAFVIAHTNEDLIAKKEINELHKLALIELTALLDGLVGIIIDEKTKDEIIKERNELLKKALIEILNEEIDFKIPLMDKTYNKWTGLNDRKIMKNVIYNLYSEKPFNKFYLRSGDQDFKEMFEIIKLGQQRGLFPEGLMFEYVEKRKATA